MGSSPCDPRWDGEDGPDIFEQLLQSTDLSRKRTAKPLKLRYKTSSENIRECGLEADHCLALNAVPDGRHRKVCLLPFDAPCYS